MTNIIKKDNAESSYISPLIFEIKSILKSNSGLKKHFAKVTGESSWMTFTEQFKKGKSVSTAMLHNPFCKAKYNEEQFAINNMEQLYKDSRLFFNK